jgi:hypothetical protein
MSGSRDPPEKYDESEGDQLPPHGISVHKSGWSPIGTDRPTLSARQGGAETTSHETDTELPTYLARFIVRQPEGHLDVGREEGRILTHRPRSAAVDQDGADNSEHSNGSTSNFGEFLVNTPPIGGGDVNGK